MTQPPSIPPKAKRTRPGSQATPAARKQAGDTPTPPPSFPPAAARSRPQPPKPRSASSGAVNDARSAAPQSQPPSFAPSHTRSRPTPPSYPPARDRRTGTPAPVAHPEGTYQRPPASLPPSVPHRPSSARPAPRGRKRARRRVAVVALVLVIALVAWPIYLLTWANGLIHHTPALSARPATDGTTWLIAGSDRRSNGKDGGISDPTQGARTDSVMLVRRVNGKAMIVSLPRDTAVTIPGRGRNKLNAAYAFGGAPLLVETVEELTGTKIDHYVEVSMGAVTQIVDAVGGVELCSDLTVNDRDSDLRWQAGCHTVDGKTALAFARMRKADPRGDFGRQDRQRQVIVKTVDAALSPSSVLNPLTQRAISGAVASSLVTDPDTGIISLGLLGWNYRKAQEAGLTGIPPLASVDYRDGIHGSMVALNPTASANFWSKFSTGDLAPGDYYTFK